MASTQSSRADQPSETVRRRPTDVVWFVVLFLSIATGLGMTMFAPVGDEPGRVAGIGMPATEPADPFITPATTTTTTSPTTAPTTAPTL